MEPPRDRAAQRGYPLSSAGYISSSTGYAFLLEVSVVAGWRDQPSLPPPRNPHSVDVKGNSVDVKGNSVD
eukprot:1183972-Prorocentrum_minimum.AAC.1